MLQKQKDLIIKNFVILMQECNVNVLKQKLILGGVFTDQEINSIFSSEDERHNKRMFFFNLQKKSHSAFEYFVETLKETGQYSVAELLEHKRNGCKAFCKTGYEDDDDDDEDERTSSIEAPVAANLTVNYSTLPLEVKVEHSDEFYDTRDRNKNLQCYQCRSKNRGRLLLINNYEFPETNHEYRKGAQVDSVNLRKLFSQLGGWVIEEHINKTAGEMSMIIRDFSLYKVDKVCDVCFVIIMSHGYEQHGETIIYGKDGNSITTRSIQDNFTNEKCKLFRGKPKVFLYQVCRGSEMDFSIRHTDTDGSQPVPKITNYRTIEDMLIGYATLPGYKAHRDPNLGTWYIQLVCEMFMKHAKDSSVDELLMMVDQGLKKIMSESRTMQTSEVGNRGFSKLYLNPGIYLESGVMKRF